MAEKCPYAYKRPGTVSLLCEMQPGQKFPICGHQHLCGVTGAVGEHAASGGVSPAGD